MSLLVTAIDRVSTTSSGVQADNGSIYPSLSPDNTKILFVSAATNLVPDDTNDRNDLFMKDLTTGVVTLISTNAAGEQGDGHVDSGFFLPDGNHILFASRSTNLVANDINNDSDFFIKDLTTGVVTLIQGNPAADQPNFYSPGDTQLSPDGTKIAFVSNANNIVPDDTNNSADIFIKDIASGNLTRITNAAGVEGNGQSYDPVFSPDGTKILFSSYADNMVSVDTSTQQDIFIKDLVTGDVSLISTDSAGIQATSQSYDAAFSPDGKKVVFVSDASNLSPDPFARIFIKDLETGTLTPVSAGDKGTLGDRFPVFFPDGTRVAFIHFHLDASNNTVLDVFAKDLITGTVSRISTDTTGIQANGISDGVHFTSDGNKMIFFSDADNLVANDTNGANDVFVVSLLEDNIVNGTGGNDTLQGRDEAETFNARSGDDVVTARGGDDIINGGKGNDTLFGMDGNDTIYGNSGADLLLGNDGDDTLYGNSEDDILFGQLGDDTLSGGTGHDTLFGDEGNDALRGDSGNDTIWGGDGDDNMLADGGDDALIGQGGRDNMHGGSGNDVLLGGGSSDRLYGDSGEDRLFGGTGTNWLTGGADADSFVINIDNFDGTVDKVTDFTTVTGDYLIVDAFMLEGFDALTSDIDDFVIGTEVSGNSIIGVDRDGSGATFAFQDVMSLRGVTGLNIQDMYDNGQIVVT